MSPEETHRRARKLRRKGWMVLWGAAVTCMILILSAASIVFNIRDSRQAKLRTEDLASAQAAARSERYRNTLDSCQTQNRKHVIAEAQLRRFFNALTPPERRTEQAAEVIHEFAAVLTTQFLQQRDCVKYARGRVRQ